MSKVFTIRVGSKAPATMQMELGDSIAAFFWNLCADVDADATQYDFLCDEDDSRRGKPIQSIDELRTMSKIELRFRAEAPPPAVVPAADTVEVFKDVAPGAQAVNTATPVAVPEWPSGGDVEQHLPQQRPRLEGSRSDVPKWPEEEAEEGVQFGGRYVGAAASDTGRPRRFGASEPDKFVESAANRPGVSDWNCPNCGFHNFKSRTECKVCKCPFPGSGEVNNNNNNNAPTRVPSHVKNGSSDWDCAKCNFKNFASRTECKVCHAPRDPARPGQVSPTPQGASDWSCPKCRFRNFGTRAECKVCGNVRGEGGEAMTRDPPPATPSNLKDGLTDWDCPECSFRNFASRTECKACRAPRRTTGARDWVCPMCNFSNFSRRTECLKCNATRPTQVDPAEQFSQPPQQPEVEAAPQQPSPSLPPLQPPPPQQQPAQMAPPPFQPQAAPMPQPPMPPPQVPPHFAPMQQQGFPAPPPGVAPYPPPPGFFAPTGPMPSAFPPSPQMLPPPPAQMMPPGPIPPPPPYGAPQQSASPTMPPLPPLPIPPSPQQRPLPPAQTTGSTPVQAATAPAQPSSAGSPTTTVADRLAVARTAAAKKTGWKRPRWEHLEPLLPE